MNVQCSWKVSDGRPISDAIFYSRETNDADLEDEINVENCVFLKAPDKSEGLYPAVPACQLLICCDPPNQITRISAICEAKVIEIYGHHGEYLKTVFNTPLEEADNLFVYRGDIALDKPLSVCSVKFVNLESQNEMWLFGVKIHTDKAAYNPMSQSVPSPFAAIQQKLESMKDSTEDKEALKRLTDNLFKMGLCTAFQQQMPATAQWKSMNENLPANWHNLLQELPSNLMQESTSKNSEETSNEKNKLLIDPNSNQPNQMSKLTLVSTSPVMPSSISTSTQTEEYSTLEEKMTQLVNDQMQVRNKRILELEAKVLCKLDEIETFVKPQGIQVEQ